MSQKNPYEQELQHFIKTFKEIFSGGKKSDTPQGPRKPFFKSKLNLFFIGVVLLFFLFKMFFVYVQPNEYGIKIKIIGPGGGIEEKVYTTGLHFVFPSMQVMEKFPRDIQIIHLTKFPNHYRRSDKVIIAPAAHIQTYDGYFVDVDLSILYHITDPLKVIQKLGKKGIYEQAVIPKVIPALKKTLGKLTTEKFYDSHLRVEEMNRAKEILSGEFEEKGLVVDQVFIRYFIYSDEIQSNIEEKKLKDQLVFKNMAEAKAAKEEANLKKVTEEGEANVAVLLEEGKAYMTTKTAEKDAYVRTMKAKANLMIKLAEADKTRLKNKALKSGGSQNLVGLEMAKTLEGIDTIILPSDGAYGINPLNLKQTLKTFEVQ
ncbi:SPFH domain-containing protein [Bacteriovoracaceae bacterium]|nr:SPFH domain-containing protein [Bacteriovoracaceae bacterium]